MAETATISPDTERALEKFLDKITEEKIRELLNDILSNPVSNETLEKLEVLKRRFDNEPDVAAAIQDAIDECKKANDESIKPFVATAILSITVGLICGVLISRK